jgi:gliding motility-associated-like protein
LPNPAFTWTPDEADFDNRILTFVATDAVTSYQWQLNGGVGTQQQFTYELNEIGEYPVKLISELDGCYDSLTQFVYFRDAFSYYEITSFTPNSDGLNDRFKPYVSGVISLNYEIYNTWGELIYRGSLEDNGWDGTYQGELSPIGNYLIVLNWQDSSRKQVYTKSVVKLLR